MEFWVGEERLRQAACVFLRKDYVFAFRYFRFDDLHKMLVVVWADNAFFDCNSECSNIIDKSLRRTEPANDCCCERLSVVIDC